LQLLYCQYQSVEYVSVLYHKLLN